MRKSIFLIALLAALSLACNFSFSTANVEAAKLAKDKAGAEQTDIFNQDDEFYLVGQLANAPDDTKLKAVWTAVEADGVEPNFQLDEKEVAGGGDFYFSLSNDQLWPTGKYKVDLYLNEELERTLEFTVEGDVVAEAPPPSVEPTPTPEPTEPAPEPTETPVDDENLTGPRNAPSEGDTLVVEATEEATEVVYDPLPFKEEPYQHPSGAFSFIVPEDWQLVKETDTSTTFGDENSVVGAVFIDAGGVLSVAEFNDFVEGFIGGYLGEETDYEIINQEPQPDDSLYVAISYDDQGTPSDADFFFEQRETVMFVLLLDTFTYNEVRPTWDEIIASYAVDAEAALLAGPAEAADSALTQDSAPAEPTVAPVPVEPAGPVAPAGKGLLYYSNKTDVDFTIDVIGPTNASQTIPPGQTKEFVLDPGKYSINAHSAGGKYYVPSYEFEIVVGQVLYDGVQ